MVGSRLRRVRQAETTNGPHASLTVDRGDVSTAPADARPTVTLRDIVGPASARTGVMAPGEKAFAHSFGTAGAECDRLRSAPPPVAAERPAGDHVHDAVEPGPGTGHSSRRLAGPVPEQDKAEPDPRRRGHGAENRRGVAVLDGSAERVPLPGQSVDAVFSTDAWRSFPPAKAAGNRTRPGARRPGRRASAWPARGASGRPVDREPGEHGTVRRRPGGRSRASGRAVPLPAGQFPLTVPTSSPGADNF